MCLRLGQSSSSRTRSEAASTFAKLPGSAVNSDTRLVWFQRSGAPGRNGAAYVANTRPLAALLEVLLERQHACPQIEERLRRQPVVRAEHAYDAILLNDEFSPAAVGRLLEMERGRQTFGNRLQGQILCRHGRGAHQHREQNHMYERFFLPMKRSHAYGDVHRISRRLRGRGFGW